MKSGEHFEVHNVLDDCNTPIVVVMDISTKRFVSAETLIHKQHSM